MNTIKKAVIFVIVLFVITLSNSCKQTKTEEVKEFNKQSKIDELISTYSENGKFNGAVLVSEESEVIYKKGFGMANMEWDIPNQTGTKFRIASITKQFTATLVLQLVSENKLDLHVPISRYLPDYPKNNADIITIHHLLTHTSGIPEFDDFVTYRDIERDRYRPEELMSIFAEGELQFTPGTEFAYTNPGYVVLGAIIEKVTGKSYALNLQEKIFTPLKMNNSGYDYNYTVLKNRASGYSNKYLRNEYVNANYVDMSIPYAAGSIYATVEDLYLWDQALYSEKLLPANYRDLLFGKYISAYNGQHYGYGWIIGGMQIGTTSDRVETIGHSGGINGFRTLIIRIPSSKSSIILLNNMEKTALYEMAVAIIGILHEQPYNPKKSSAYTLFDKINSEGITKGLEHYKETKSSSDYYLDIDELNIAGYELMWADKLEEALIVFELNVKAFPESFIVYDSYGEGLLVKGDTIQAIENYKKSVELNPKSRGGINILKELGVDTDNLSQ